MFFDLAAELRRFVVVLCKKSTNEYWVFSNEYWV